MLGGELDTDVDDWVVLTVDGLRLAFQLADDFAPPTWPSGERPQQFHLDMTVDDVDAVEQNVLALGAGKHAIQPGEDAGDRFRVYLDPAGHPFASAGTDGPPAPQLQTRRPRVQPTASEQRQQRIVQPGG